MTRSIYITSILIIMIIYNIKFTDGFSGVATFFNPGIGACGVVSQDTDLVFALPASMFDASPAINTAENENCGKRAEVKRNDRSVTVTCVDRCVGCSSGDISLSPAAFSGIADLGEGRVGVTWQFV